jgi:hypothetical protein
MATTGVSNVPDYEDGLVWIMLAKFLIHISQYTDQQKALSIVLNT